MSGGGMGVSSTGLGQPSGVYPGQQNPMSSATINSTMADDFGANARELRPMQITSASPADQITGFYQHILQRAPEEEGLNFWKQKASEGMSLQDIQNNFLQSKEFTGNQQKQAAYADYMRSLQPQPATPAPVVETPYVPTLSTFNAQPAQAQTFNAPTITQSSDTGGAMNYQYRRGGIASLLRR